MELGALGDMCGIPNDTSGCHLAVFSVDIAFSCHFVATPTLHPIEVLMVFGYASKMAVNSASYFPMVGE